MAEDDRGASSLRLRKMKHSSSQNLMVTTERVKKVKKKVKAKTSKPKEEDEIPLSEENEALSQTKVMFNQLLQKALEQQSPRESDKNKKKKKAETSPFPKGTVLESWGKHQMKDMDSTATGNTHDPNKETKGSNKRTTKLQEKSESLDETASPKYMVEIVNETQLEVGEKKWKKTAKKTKCDKPEKEDSKKLLDNFKEKPHKTRSEDKADRQESKHEKVRDQECLAEEGSITAPDTEGEISDATSKTDKKTEEPQIDREAGAVASVSYNSEDVAEILAVIIHRTDKLKNDFYIMHPLVRVHIVDEKTGQYLKKKHSKRPVTSYFEMENEKTDYILPIMTQPFDFKQKKSTLPIWEELLIFNENYDYFIRDEPKVIVFFEILDFVSMNTASQQYSQKKHEGGWYKIAWAFLKILGANKNVNTGNKVRLQLFQPPYRAKVTKNKVELYNWWMNYPHVTYPSTLYITLKKTVTPESLEPSMRSMYATQAEKGQLSYSEFERSAQQGLKGADQKRNISPWSRLIGQVCRIPNSLMLKLHGGYKGCFFVKFSHNGRSLACSCHEVDGYTVLVYEIPSGELKKTFSGHLSIVYELCWSKKDMELLSASADGTARVWDISSGDEPKTILPHPSFVYTAQFHVRIESLVITGGYDCVIRVWDINRRDIEGQLLQEIDHHTGHVNSLCFSEDGLKMYSADSVGVIVIWNVYFTEGQGFARDWTLFMVIDDREFKGVPINCLRLHPQGRKLLVHCRDNIIRMIDLRFQRVIQRYFGALNFRQHLLCTITPCGSFVFSGSEDQAAYVWNADTGDQVVVYSGMNYQNAVTCVEYHPRDHIVAVCSLGENHPIYLYKYNSKITEIGITCLPKDQPSPEFTEDDEKLQGAAANRFKESSESTGPPEVLTQDEFQVQQGARYEKIMRKLNTVSSASARLEFLQTLPPIVPINVLQGSWRLSYSPKELKQGIMPSVFSPHASKDFDLMIKQQQFMAQSKYLKKSDGWRPGFSPVGRCRSSIISGPSLTGRQPHITLNMEQGKPHFTFEQPAARSAKSDFKHAQVLYDYQAQRADELSLIQGDIILILYKDSENWWMGESCDGQQGFLPASYVVERGNSILDLTDVGMREMEDKRKQITAVKGKDNDLKFLSGTEESEDEAFFGKRNKQHPSPRSVLLSSDHNKPKLFRKSLTFDESTL